MRPATRPSPFVPAVAVGLLALTACSPDPGPTPSGGTPPGGKPLDGTGETPAAQRPNVAIWLVDTLRADRTSAYGHERDTTPVLSELAANGVRFDEFHVNANWTAPSILALLTGMYPVAFGAGERLRAPRQMTMAAEWFWEQGYHTAAFTQSTMTARTSGHPDGYDDFEDAIGYHPRSHPDAHNLASEHLVNAVEDWLVERDDEGRPFFLYMHTLDPHIPLGEHEGFPSFVDPSYDGPWSGDVPTLRTAREEDWVPDDDDVQHLLDLYDTEVRYADAQLGRLVEALRAAGELDDTLLVIVSDHGEEFFERGARGHAHNNLFRELSHVPLVLHWPAGLEAGTVVDATVRGIDLMPTLLELAGVEALPEVDGRSVAVAVLGRGELEPVPVRMARYTTGPNAYAGILTRDFLAVRRDSHPRASLRLFADASGLEEFERGSAERAAFTDPATELLDGWTALRAEREARFPAEEETLTDEVRARLEELGYLNGAAGGDQE